jgi:hypothetical protein
VRFRDWMALSGFVLLLTGMLAGCLLHVWGVI